METVVAANKMKKAIIFLGYLLIVVMMVGCQDYGNKHYYHELEKIEHRQNRELARREIMALKSEIAPYPDYIKKYHQLLVAELNEEVSPYRNMDAARQLVDYYELANLEEAYKLAKEAGLYREQKELMIDIASCYCYNERYRMALNYLRPLIKIIRTL